MHAFNALLLSVWLALALALAVRAEAQLATRAPAYRLLPLLVCAPIVAYVVLGPQTAATFTAAFACIGIVVAAFGDARTGYLFDAITFPSGFGTAALAVWSGSAAEAAAGVVLLVGVFGGIYVFTRGRAIGLGDVKAMYAIGAGFGPANAVVAIFAASVSGIVLSALHSLLRSLDRRAARESREIRFGMHLAIGSTFALLIGDRIVRGILGL